jgi:hypothetical protein
MKFELEKKFDLSQSKNLNSTRSFRIALIMLFLAYPVAKSLPSNDIGLSYAPIVFPIIIAFSISFLLRSLLQKTGLDIRYNNLNDAKRLILFLIGLLVISGVSIFVVPIFF